MFYLFTELFFIIGLIAIFFLQAFGLDTNIAIFKNHKEINVDIITIALFLLFFLYLTRIFFQRNQIQNIYNDLNSQILNISLTNILDEEKTKKAFIYYSYLLSNTSIIENKNYLDIKNLNSFLDDLTNKIEETREHAENIQTQKKDIANEFDLIGEKYYKDFLFYIKQNTYRQEAEFIHDQKKAINTLSKSFNSLKFKKDLNSKS